MRLIFNYKFQITLGFLIVILFFGLRLPNLTLQPIFADEAIYIRWAQVMRAEPTLRFLPLSDGKTPLYMWILMPVLKIFSDPLFAGRFLSVMAGFFTLVGVFFLAKRIFSLRVAFWSSLIYAVVPYTVFFDRMALVDSMLAAFTVWAMFFAVWLVQSQRLDLAMILGYLLGGAMLTKTPGLTNLFALPFTIIGFDFKNRKKYGLVKLLGFLIVSLVIALGMYNLLRLGPEFMQLSKRNTDYVFSLSELVGRPLDPFIPHFRDILDIFPKLLTFPILIFSLIGIFFTVFKFNRLALGILIWAFIPLLLQMAFLKTFTARYLLISIPVFIIMAGYGINEMLQIILSSSRKRGSTSESKSVNWIPAFAGMTVMILILPLALRFDYQLLTNPANAPLPKNERRGYLEDWTAGYGFKDLSEFFIEKKKTGSVVIGTEGYFGTLPEGLQIYLDKSGISILGGRATVSAELKEAAKDNQTYLVINKSRLAGTMKGANQIFEYPKAIPWGGEPRDAIVVYQVIPE